MNVFMQRLFKRASLRVRITCLYLIFVTIVIGCITFFTYRTTVRTLTEKESLILNDSIYYLERQISDRISTINEEFIDTFDNARFLELYAQNLNRTDDFSSQLTLENEFRDYFYPAKLRHRDILESVILMTNNHLVYSDSYNPLLNYSQFVGGDYYTQAIGDKNKILYRNVEPDSDYFCILRSFYYTAEEGEGGVRPSVGYLSNNNEDYATLLFFLKKSYLEKIIQSESQKRQTGVIILDEAGAPVVESGVPQEMGEEDYEQLSGLIAETESGSLETTMKGIPTGIHYRSIDYAGWKIVYVYDQNILYKEAEKIGHTGMVVFAGAVLAVLVIAGALSNSVVRPIRSLGKAMDSALENNLEVDFKPPYEDEIADLSKTFNRLMKRISELLKGIRKAEEQKRTEELKALQAQINPHFLYNTLDTVYWLAKMENSEHIAELISDLASFFRLSLNQGEDITTVEREVEHVKKYLDIQRVRMNGKFDYTMNVSEEIRECLVPKLILQPFVENTLIHGFEKIDYRGKIDVQICREQDDVVFEILDNGMGMSAEQIRNINIGKYSSTASGGYAVGNVIERIQLYAGTAYGVEFFEQEGKGVRVEMRFPINLQQGESQDDENNYRRR